MKTDSYVLCRVFHKNNIGPPNGNRYAPFIEEEWDDGVTALVPGEDAVDDVPVHDTCTEINRVEQVCSLFCLCLLFCLSFHFFS